MTGTATYLAEAKAALHKLLTGSAVVEVRTEAGTMRYNEADLEKLESYVSSLERDVAGKPRRRAVGALF
ncbi:MAG: gpW family head-tail joining protein [Pseudomonadota bacterium]